MLKVSCLCATYNRAPLYLNLVEEAVESFLRQDYPNKELIVFNDTPGQTLHFDHPEVQVVNTPFRCASLGEKRNLLAAMADGELICIWDDDDISLPWRLSRSVVLLGDADYYNPGAYWYLDGNGLHHDHAVGFCYNASLYRKCAFDDLGGHPSISVGEDAAMDAKLRTRNVAMAPPLARNEWFYIYRWGVSPVHISGRGLDSFWETIGERPIQPGEYVLKPHWEQDYIALTQAHALMLDSKMTNDQ
jgi:glycosyltransferase involved in cell wall biosynthesis